MSRRAATLAVVLTTFLALLTGFTVGYMYGGTHWRKEFDQCDRQHSDLLRRMFAVESPEARPCVACVIDRSDTPYCKALCGPTPMKSLRKLYPGVE